MRPGIHSKFQDSLYYMGRDTVSKNKESNKQTKKVK